MAQFSTSVNDLRLQLLQTGSVARGEWQSQASSIPTMELQHVILEVPILAYQQPSTLARLVKANLPWAEDHFQERVGGQPLNPPPSEAWWPYAQQGNAEHKSGQLFSHTYPERMWPKHAHANTPQLPEPSRCSQGHPISQEMYWTQRGIRFAYGDLGDVVEQLKKNPLTRQAYLPIWFPEDTGAVHGERVPCTLGYHFLMNGGKLDITYFIRSCDFVRHFSDDVYMAMRLCQWVANESGIGLAGNLVMHIGSLHAFEPDRYSMTQVAKAELEEFNQRLMESL